MQNTSFTEVQASKCWIQKTMGGKVHLLYTVYIHAPKKYENSGNLKKNISELRLFNQIHITIHFPFGLTIASLPASSLPPCNEC